MKLFKWPKIVALSLFWCSAEFVFAESTAAACPEGTVISSIRYEGLEQTKHRVVEREL